MGLKVAAYAALFFVVLLYPWNGGTAGEARVGRALLRCLAGTAVAVAVLALVQRFAWNGRILWFFIPLDWPSGLPDPRPRVSGPFISRNSLAGYLSLLLPLVVVWSTVRSHLDAGAPTVGRRLLRWAGATAVATAILLSLSRGGWIAAAAGMLCLVVLLQRLPRGERPAWLRARRLAAAAAIAAVLAAGLALVPFDEGEPNDLDARIAQTFSDSSSLVERVGYWRAASRLVRDFPLLGVGLGAWPEIALRYDPAPAGGGFPREVHSDYLQLLAETGLVGALLAGVFAVALVQRIGARLAVRSPAGLPIAAAALAGMVALATHAFVDFDFQIPAVPVALAILAAAAARPLLPRAEPRRRVAARVGAGALASAAICAAALALAQPSLVDPRDARRASSTAAAIELAAVRPTNPLPHLRLYERLGAAVPASLRRRELEIAIWLAPREPVARDLLAAELARAGDEREALARIEESVRLAPRAGDHPYLSPRIVPWLDDAELGAVERGLRSALGEHRDAPATLADVLAARGRFRDGAEVLLAAAEREPRPRERGGLLIAASDLLFRAGVPARAEPALRSALAIAPASTAAWTRLIAAATAAPAAQDGAAAAAPPAPAEDRRALAERGIAAGADPAELWFAVAEVAKRDGAREERRAALERALRARPALAKVHFEMGLLELEEDRPERAARSLARAADLAPESAAAWYHLGRAERAAYRLGDARRAFERVLAIEPTHAKARAAIAGLPPARDRVASTR
jgi:O-antigen ligase